MCKHRTEEYKHWRSKHRLVGKIIDYAGAISLIGIFSLFGGIGLSDYFRAIPNENQVQAGYIAPSELEIEVKDLDNNGELETIMKVGDTEYLLREVDGKPHLSEYKVETKVKIVPD